MSRLDDLRRRYEAALHGMQAGVALEEARGAKNMTPKHLRVGVNSAMVDSAALALALIRKGVLTEEEYFEALAETAEREKEAYEERLSVGGVKVTLV
jgi:hypothetical protein